MYRKTLIAVVLVTLIALVLASSAWLLKSIWST